MPPLTTSELVGRIIDESNGNPAPAQTVHLRNSADQVIDTIVTDATGRWKFHIYTSGDYSVVHPSSNEELEFSVTVPGGDLVVEVS